MKLYYMAISTSYRFRIQKCIWWIYRRYWSLCSGCFFSFFFLQTI